ncbi:MAG: cyclic 2,3-diphosphoglycerate synthase [Candidatus Eisenbacteria bacterium]|nr:cyclic 2,3-diphosphoglycerate synthase [Candidatus Eisenbacteria bacterium]
MKSTRVVIMGAGGRDFHNFNTYFKDNREYEVVCFTATQIPNIENRTFPAELAGALYPKGIPIVPEQKLPSILKEQDIDEVVFAYSDVSHEYVMHAASVALAAGCDFRIIGPKRSTIRGKIPVVAILAVRTGAGKSPVTRKVASLLRDMGKRVVVVRHPMPYGDLARQNVQRFEKIEDLDLHDCTIEEREEYEPHIENGIVLFAGVDYAQILKAAEAEADVVVWDGGNNDMSFYEPSLTIVVVDPLRPDHGLRYHPGETNLRCADVIIINKEDSATPEAIEAVKKSVRTVNPGAEIIDANSPILVDRPELIKGKRALAIDDGPTLTHGGMSFGAGVVAARRYGAKELIDPRPFAVGDIKSAFEHYPHIGAVLPAIGYGDKQVKELEATIKACNPEVVIIATPTDLRRIVSFEKPTVRVRYELEEIGTPRLAKILTRAVK